MENCIELIYDRFRIEVYKPAGLSFTFPWQQHKKALTTQELDFVREPELTFGTLTDAAANQFRLNDTFDDITTSISEEHDEKHQYKVNLHCEFNELSPAQIEQLTALDEGIHHYVLRSGFKGQELTRVVRCGEEGQARAVVTNVNGVTALDIEITNVNGIMTVG